MAGGQRSVQTGLTQGVPSPSYSSYIEDVVNLSRGRPIAFDYVGFEPDIHD